MLLAFRIAGEAAARKLPDMLEADALEMGGSMLTKRNKASKAQDLRRLPKALFPLLSRGAPCSCGKMNKKDVQEGMCK